MNSLTAADPITIVPDFEGKTGLKVRLALSGAKLTTYSIGGPIAYFVELNSEAEIGAALRFLLTNGQPYRVIGAGSNLLIDDAGLDCWMLRLGPGFRTVSSVGPGSVFAAGACSLMTLSRELSDSGLSGLEFAGGIPASLGGGVYMNAGAHRGELAQVVESVDLVGPDGKVTLASSELQFSYRHSLLPRDHIVTGALLKLTPGDSAVISKTRAQYLAERKKKQPLSSASAGSVFKNPSPELSAGELIDRAGLKGKILGGAKISELHGNWIVNESRQAKAKDVLGLIALCQERILELNKISLEPEVLYWS